MVPKPEFTLYQHLKTIEDDSEIFPNLARIPYAMLIKVYLTHHVLIAYLSNINPNVETRVLLPNGIEGTSK